MPARAGEGQAEGRVVKKVNPRSCSVTTFRQSKILYFLLLQLNSDDDDNDDDDNVEIVGDEMSKPPLTICLTYSQLKRVAEHSKKGKERERREKRRQRRRVGWGEPVH